MARRGVLRATSPRTWMDQTLRPLLASMARYGVLVITVVAVLNQFGVETTSIIAVLGAAGLAVGLALQGTLSNVAAGLMILILRPFRVGDYIEAGGVAGTNVELGLFITELTTPITVISACPTRPFSAAILLITRAMPGAASMCRWGSPMVPI